MLSAHFVVAITAVVLLSGAPAPVLGACKDEPRSVVVDHTIPLTEVRLLLAESEERSRLIVMQMERQYRRARPELEELKRLLCAHEREFSVWRDLMNLKHKKEGCLLIGFPPRCSIQF
jgi:hypothetical protein